MKNRRENPLNKLPSYFCNKSQVESWVQEPLSSSFSLLILSPLCFLPILWFVCLNCSGFNLWERKPMKTAEIVMFTVRTSAGSYYWHLKKPGRDNKPSFIPSCMNGLHVKIPENCTDTVELILTCITNKLHMLFYRQYIFVNLFMQN